MNVLISMAIIVMMTIMAIGLMMTISTQTVESAKAYSQVSEVEQFLNQVDNAIKEVSSEGQGATRVLKVVTKGEFVVDENEESIHYHTPTAGSFEYLSRRLYGNMLYIAGSDVNCYESDANGDGKKEIVAENTYLKAVFQKINRTASLASMNTEKNILSLTEKNSGATLTLSNSSIVIDENLTTSYGSGYSEILKPGNNLPLCRVHFYINSTAMTYDIYYTLYSAADFLVVDVRNVADK